MNAFIYFAVLMRQTSFPWLNAYETWESLLRHIGTVVLTTS